MMSTKMRPTTPAGILGVCLLVPLLTASSTASAVCGWSPTYCQTQDQYHHSLVLFDSSWNSPNWGNANTITFGTYGGYLRACVDGTLYWVWDDYVSDWDTQLRQDSYICLGAGNDALTVATGTTSACGVSLGAFAYAGYALQVFGQAGADTLSGGAGRDDLCGGSGRDILQGGAGADRLDGHDNGDVVSGGEGSDYSYGDFYGGTTGYGGGDRIIDSGWDGTYANVLYGGDNESYYDCLHDNSGGPKVIDCGTGTFDYSPNSPSATVVNCDSYTSSCSGWWVSGIDQ